MLGVSAASLGWECRLGVRAGRAIGSVGWKCAMVVRALIVCYQDVGYLGVRPGSVDCECGPGMWNTLGCDLEVLTLCVGQ